MSKEKKKDVTKKGIDPNKIKVDDKGKVKLDQEQLDDEQLISVTGGARIEIIRGVSCGVQVVK